MVCNRIYYNIYCIVKKLAKDIVKKILLYLICPF